MNQHVIRPVRADEWEKVKELRIAALRDPVADLAFLETEEAAAGRPDAFWQERTEGASHGRSVRQFIAEAPDGTWNGNVVVLVEEAGTTGIFDEDITVHQGHLVGVFVRPEERGSGLTEALFEAALEWAWSLEEPALERVRLFVHEENGRAAAFYRRFGFEATGLSVPVPTDTAGLEVEYVFPRPSL
ncbi:GNAT family N-acetyltransferase [Streptomyces sp. NPDC059989]|uniref:GNAT family N-acetyltransferase n=1 Tax=Streptomyces sp. NPDC059989 TaxID=3347026 RepID=UPI0036C20DB8